MRELEFLLGLCMNYANMILNLDESFKPLAGEEISFESFYFSGGEPHIKINETDLSDNAIITHRLNSFNDLGLLLVAVDALKRLKVKSIEVFIPYFPAARQDRVMVKGEPLTVKVYADIINSLRLENVTVFDPHSEVTPALLDNCTTINNHSFIKTVLNDLPKDILLVSPDGGALKKIHKLASFLQDYEVLECGKSRDVRTGKLSGFTVPLTDLASRDCLIVDDICDGGGTFLGLAEELKKCNAGTLHLAVSHGIFSKGSRALAEKFGSIYCTDSISTEIQEGVKIISIQQLINHEI